MTPAFFFRQMFLIRTVERMFLELFAGGHIDGTVHTCIGQEACAVGVMNAIDSERDIVFSNHRAHGHIIAYGIPLDELIAEVLGKASGICSGIGGSQHLHWRNFYTTGIQGGLVPVAVGAALAEKFKKTGAIVVVFLGDGTMGQGIVYEGFNLAALWSLPILFVLEDNKYAQSTRRQEAHAGNLCTRSESFGIPFATVDGNRVEHVYETAGQIIMEMGRSQRPRLLILDTYRLGPHSKGDDHRSRDEVQLGWDNDPVLLVRNTLDPDEVRVMEERVLTTVRKTFERVMTESPLSAEEFLRSYRDPA